jgi:hypothetical protein
MKCRCKAKLDACDVSDAACPASTHRLMHDEIEAMQELYDFAQADQKEEQPKKFRADSMIRI